MTKKVKNVNKTSVKSTSKKTKIVQKQKSGNNSVQVQIAPETVCVSSCSCGCNKKLFWKKIKEFLKKLFS